MTLSNAMSGSGAAVFLPHEFKTCSLTLLLAIAWTGFFAALGDAQDANALSAATDSTPAASQPSGPVIDPAIALPDAMDNTRFPPAKPDLPTLFLCGDSTMDSRPNPKEPLINNFRARIGWGGSVIPYFDTSRINVENHAKGGTSTRTFMNEGYWQAILPRLKAGDFVVLEFGHNDSSDLGGPTARGTLKSTGGETKQIVNKAGQIEVVHSYGWYLRRFISDIKSKGATPVVLSPVPRNYWKDKTTFNNVLLDYTRMAKEVADAAQVQYIDMNETLASQYSPMGQDAVTRTFFTSLDKTHTNPAGAKNAAKFFVGELRKSDCPLKNYLLDSPTIPDISPIGSGD
jgi:lysophospholipase L1-like esterase